MKTKLLLSLLLVPWLCGCVTSSPSRDLSLQAEMMHLDERLTALEKGLEAERQKRREQFVQLQGQLDRYRSERLQAASDKEAGDKKPVQEAPPEDGEAAEPSGPSPEKQPKPATPQDIYHEALALLLEKERPAEAQAMFQRFLASYPDHPLLPNASYWLGECFYVQKHFARSIVAFKEVFNRYPDTSKAADALLKMGYAYSNLGQHDNAAFYLQRLTEKYPSSNAAKLARKKLSSMN
jgi:tol-pal system protein YbgF